MDKNKLLTGLKAMVFPIGLIMFMLAFIGCEYYNTDFFNFIGFLSIVVIPIGIFLPLITFKNN